MQVYKSRGLNIILSGPPGSGKTYTANHLKETIWPDAEIHDNVHIYDIPYKTQDGIVRIYTTRDMAV